MSAEAGGLAGPAVGLDTDRGAPEPSGALVFPVGRYADDDDDDSAIASASVMGATGVPVQ